MGKQLLSLYALKGQARELVETGKSNGTKIGHARALEEVAHRHGFASWRAAQAALIDAVAPEGRECTVHMEDRVKGMTLADLRAAVEHVYCGNNEIEPGMGYEARVAVLERRIDFIGSIAGSGTPYSEEEAQAAGVDYVCALDDGSFVILGAERLVAGVAQRDILVQRPSGSVEAVWTA